jgi:hypothetical protein
MNEQTHIQEKKNILSKCVKLLLGSLHIRVFGFIDEVKKLPLLFGTPSFSLFLNLFHDTLKGSRQDGNVL